MARRSNKELSNWEETTYRDRVFVCSKVPKGANEGQPYSVAKRIAERYEVRGFFASGGCGLLLSGRDLRTETDVLIKTTLRYDVISHAKVRDKEGVTKQLKGPRKQLQTERRIMVLLKNQGCNAVPNPNDYVFDWNPILEGPYQTDDGREWRYDDEAMLSSEPYLILEQIAGQTVANLLERVLRRGMDEPRALRIIHQITNVLRVLHRPIQMQNGTVWELIYQDLKPANILLGPHDYAVLLDMGGCFVRIDKSPGMRGASTPGYCPPECETDRDGFRWTPALDSFAVGSTLYHMLTGTSPAAFLTSSLSSAGPKAVPFDRWDWQLLEKKCSNGTAALIRRCLSPRLEERPANGGSLHQEIASLMR